MWLYPRPGRSQLYDIYGSMQYYSNKDFFSKDKSKIYGYVDYLAERINRQYGYRKIVRKVKEQYLRKNLSSAQKAKWLDVGCGLGFLMDVAFDEGFVVSGVEFSLPAIQYIRSKYTFPVTYGLLSEIEFDEKYDVVSMFDVIEHLIDPISDLQKLRQHIEDDGILIIQTMDCDSLVSKLLGKKLEDFRRTREHLFFFNRNSLKKILDHCGWKILDVRLHGQTFQLSTLIERTAVYSPIFSRLLKAMIYPKWLLEANIFVNPGTKMLVFANAKKS
jgi:2-polyprenyl-3-methyl-5-hydroxy-6-metoxy-1,4-benzoquinol methylase